MLGKNVSLLMPEPDRSQHDGYIGHHLQTGERQDHRHRPRRHRPAARRADVSRSTCRSANSTIDGEQHFTGILHDLSRRTELEERLREATALARLGEMAAVIAHEVKNPLAAVRGAIQVIGSRLPASTNDAAIIKEIIARIDALNDLIQDLLVFARPPAPKPVADRSAGAGRRRWRRCSSAIRRFAELEVTIDRDAPPLPADPNLLTIALQNLLINAAQAQQGRGTIRVTLAPRTAGTRVEIARLTVRAFPRRFAPPCSARSRPPRRAAPDSAWPPPSD